MPQAPFVAIISQQMDYNRICHNIPTNGQHYGMISQQMDNIMATNGQMDYNRMFRTAFMTNAVTVERKIQT
jgi:hypothetical protein